MLGHRFVYARAVTRISRSRLSDRRPASTLGDFTTTEAKGVKIASVDDGHAAAAITVVVKAGSRYESAPGLAHSLKNFTFRNTAKRSALRLTRETELLGGILSTSLDRECLYLTAEFLRDDAPFFVELLGDAVTQATFETHEFNESVAPAVAAQYAQAHRLPVVAALEAAHQLAFHSGLGNSLFATPGVPVVAQQVAAYGQRSFLNSANLAVLATGVSSSALSQLVPEFFVTSATAVDPIAKSQYFGGEVRLAHGSTSGNGTLILAFPGGSTAQPQFEVLRHALGGESAVKWSQTGNSVLSQLTQDDSRVAAKAFHLAYSDIGLFGIILSGPASTLRAEAEKALGALDKLAKALTAEELKRAIAKAKFEVAAARESRVGRLELVGAQILSGSPLASLSDTLAALDKVTVKQVTEAAASLRKSKATVVAVGNPSVIPYASDLGL